MLASLPKVTETELRGLQRECIRLMRLEDDKFPGSQPVSFERRHLTPEDEEATRRGVSLLKQEFYAAEKTDGVRYMLLIMGERGAFMVDRNFEMKYATEGSNPRLADPTQVCYSHVRALPWTGGCRRRCASRRARPARRPSTTRCSTASSSRTQTPTASPTLTLTLSRPRRQVQP